MVLFSHAMSFGETVTLLEAGNSKIYATCERDDIWVELRIRATSTTDGWYSSFGPTTSRAPGAIVSLFSQARITGSSEYFVPAGGQHIMDPDGWHLAIDRETMAVGLNVFGYDCVVSGSGFVNRVFTN